MEEDPCFQLYIAP
jgi:hypothetical protein